MVTDVQMKLFFSALVWGKKCFTEAMADCNWPLYSHPVQTSNMYSLEQIQKAPKPLSVIYSAPGVPVKWPS